MGLKKHKNICGDLVDDVNYLVMYGSQVSSAIAYSIYLVTIRSLSKPCGVYSIENNTKYTIIKRGGLNEYWGIIHIMDGMS